MGKPVLKMIYISGGFSTHLLVNKILFDSQNWENHKEQIGTSPNFVGVLYRESVRIQVVVSTCFNMLHTHPK